VVFTTVGDKNEVSHVGIGESKKRTYADVTRGNKKDKEGDVKKQVSFFKVNSN
jgi:hypothetical protein